MERRTRQRAAIQDVLWAASHPLTPVEVLAEAQLRVPGLGLATVYRTLRAMLDDFTAILVEIPGSTPRYESAHLGHHHHFHCRSCRRVFEIDGCPGDLRRLAPPGFELAGHEVTLYGRCTQCVGV